MKSNKDFAVLIAAFLYWVVMALVLNAIVLFDQWVSHF